MKKYLILFIAVLALSFCSVKTHKSEFEFANQLAKEDLWKEAHLRWQRALKGGVNNAAIHNNMAIALEVMGKEEEAEKEYKIAMKMAPNNSHIKSNYDNFMKKDKDGSMKKKKNDRPQNDPRFREGGRHD